MGEAISERAYVTYRALWGSLAVVIGLLTGLFSIYVGQLDKKVSRELYEERTRQMFSDLGKINEMIEANGRAIRRQGKNQELVLRHLKIEPVRDID